MARTVVPVVLFCALAACGASSGPSIGGASEAGAPSGADATPAALSAAIGPAAALPLVEATSLKYVGAFRFPVIPNPAAACDTYQYGGRGLAFNPEGNGGAGSLFATAHVHCGKTGEFAIPAPRADVPFERLPVAAFVQRPSPTGLTDAIEGALASAGITGGTDPTVNGLLVHQGRLLVSAGNPYAPTQPVTHWSRPLNLAARGDVRGAATVRGDGLYANPRYTAGYMCHVPAGLRPLLGGPALTGLVADSIVSGSSNGPAAFAFDPAEVRGPGRVAARPLVFYPLEQPLEESVRGAVQEVWNWTSIPRGCVLPDGTRSLLFIGRHGAGTFDYGVGGVNGRSSEEPRRPIYDPSDESSGEHAWPYRYQVWAYDVLDLAAVGAGRRRPESVRPYRVWTIKLPFEVEAGAHSLEGMAYDPRTRRLFLVQSDAGPFGEPAVHVLEVTVAAATQ